MRIARLLTLTASVIILLCGYGAGKSASAAKQDWAFKMEKVWEVQQAGEDKLLKPGELRVADDGTMYYRDFEQGYSYIIDRDGKLIGKFAPKGNNEGELSFYFNCFPAGKFIVICAPDKLHYFTREGKFVKAIPNNLFARFPLAFKDDREFWAGPGALGDAPGGTAEVTNINLASGKETTVYKFALSDDEKKPSGGGVIVGLTPQAKMALDPKTDRIYFGKNSDSIIYRIDGNGDKIDSFSFTMNRYPVSKADKESHFARSGLPKERMASMVGVLPDRMAYYNRMQVVDGLLYLFSAENISGTPTGLIVNIFSPNGAHLYSGRIQVENGWHIYFSPENLQLTSGFVYATEENDQGDKKIVKYKVALPQP